MIRKRIVIGSVLKPVDDVRHFHKLALSMAKANKYEINIIGFKSKNSPAHPNITFQPVFDFRRISLKRFFAPLRFLKILLQLKPEVIIANTPELLIVSSINKILFGTQIIYDIQEDYHLNIRFLSPMPAFIKPLAAWAVRLQERLSAPWVDQFLLAEKSYTALPFIGSRYTLLENKAPEQPPHPELQLRARLLGTSPLFLFSGTLSLNYGLHEAVGAFKSIQAYVPGSRLLICGRSHDERSHQFLKELSLDKGVEVRGGKDGVPHADICRAIQQADVGLVYYPDNPAINGCFPTKIWEYMSYRLPMFIQPGKPWTAWCLEKKAAAVCDGVAAQQWWSTFLATEFYPPAIDYSDIYWKSEEPKLLAVMDKLLG